MRLTDYPIGKVVVVSLVAGVVLFAAVFLGIQAAFAMRGDSPSFTPDRLPHSTSLSVGDRFSGIPVTTATGSERVEPPADANRPTVLCILMPGCSPCKDFITTWQEKGLSPTGYSPARFVALVAGQPVELTDAEREILGDGWELCFAEPHVLEMELGVHSFPTVIGLKLDHTIGFVGGAHSQMLDRHFLDKYL